MNVPCSNCKKECLSELIGTYILVLIGPATVIIVTLFPTLDSFASLLIIAIAFGGTVGLMIFALEKHSGSIINPAITLAKASARQLDKSLVVPYLIFQILGGVLAGLTLRLLFGSVDTTTNLGSTQLISGMSPSEGIIIEAVGTFILASAALIASIRIKSSRGRAIFVGTTLSTLILFIGPLTGAGFNPARSLGPSLASTHLDNLYIYFVGPILGAVSAGLMFRAVRAIGESQRKRNSVCMC
jgi:MIP family channel proteins